MYEVEIFTVRTVSKQNKTQLDLVCLPLFPFDLLVLVQRNLLADVGSSGSVQLFVLLDQSTARQETMNHYITQHVPFECSVLPYPPSHDWTKAEAEAQSI